MDQQQLPHYPRGERRVRDIAVEERFNQLKSWRSAKANELEMDPGILINNALLETIARTQPHREEDLNRIDGLKNWQRQVLGPDLIGALS